MLGMLKDKALDEHMDTFGYVIMPFLAPDEIELFKQLYKKHHPVPPPAFYKSYFSPDYAYKMEVEGKIKEFFNAKLANQFQNSFAMGGMFVVKPPMQKGHFPAHQDWSFVDETKSWSINMWCPLEDVNDENGNIQVLLGSHKFIETIRGYGTPDVYADLREIVDDYMVPLPMKAGEALFFFHGLVHGSTPNTTNNTRVSLGLSLLPENTPLLYHYIDPESEKKQLERFISNEDFYINYVHHRNKRPTDLESLGMVDFSFEQLSPDALIKKCEVLNPGKSLSPKRHLPDIGFGEDLIMVKDDETIIPSPKPTFLQKIKELCGIGQ